MSRHNCFQYAFFASGAVVLANGILLCFLTSLHLGVFLTLFLGCFLLACGVFMNQIRNKLPAWLRYSFLACILVLCVIVTFFYVYGSCDTADYTEDVLVVLGCGIRGEEITTELQKRLDSAVCYHQKNPSAFIAVSGGQGPGEDITEALAMQRYLIQQGVPEAQILLEERSTSTNENFAYTKQLLDAHFANKEYRVAFVTSDYHIFRATQLAEHQGFPSPTHVHSNTPYYSIISNGLRECVGILKMWWIDT